MYCGKERCEEIRIIAGGGVVHHSRHSLQPHTRVNVSVVRQQSIEDYSPLKGTVSRDFFLIILPLGTFAPFRIITKFTKTITTQGWASVFNSQWCRWQMETIPKQKFYMYVESLLISVFFLAPRDQLRQQNQPATSSTAGYPKQPATSGQPATPAL